MNRLAPLLPILLAGSLLTTAANWPEFRGPTRDGLVPDGGKALPTEWSEEKNITWKVAIHGAGWSTPIINKGKIWLTTATLGGHRMSVLCLDAKTGEVLLDRVLVTNDNPEPLSNPVNSYASSTGVVEDGRVYLHFGSYGTFCLDAKTFEVLWQRRDLTASHWRGPASSAALWNDKLILTFDAADQQYHVALNKENGETTWRRDRSTNFGDENPKNGRPANSGDMRKAYSTPIFAEVGGKTQMVCNAAKAAWAYDPETGDELWSIHYKTHSPSSRTVFSEDLGLFYINTGLGKAEIWAVRADPEARGEISESHLEWKLLKRTPKRSSPVLAEGLIFMANDGVATCADAKTGDAFWSERAGGDYSASLLYGSGHVYYFDEEGVGTVIKPGREFQKVAENHLDAGMMASPAACDGALFIRTKTHLYRIEEK